VGEEEEESRHVKMGNNSGFFCKKDRCAAKGGKQLLTTGVHLVHNTGTSNKLRTTKPTDSRQCGKIRPGENETAEKEKKLWQQSSKGI